MERIKLEEMDSDNSSSGQQPIQSPAFVPAIKTEKIKIPIVTTPANYQSVSMNENATTVPVYSLDGQVSGEIKVQYSDDVGAVQYMETEEDEEDGEEPATYTEDVQKLYECNECGQRFTREYYVQRHKLAVHSVDKPYKCEECDREFSQSQGLARHMISHTGEKSYVCDRCQKTFGFKSNLDRHKRNICYKDDIHQSPAPIPGVKRKFRCENCLKEFSLKSNFERHKRTVCFTSTYTPTKTVVIKTNGPPPRHKCVRCHKMFGTPYNLMRHKRAVCFKEEYLAEAAEADFKAEPIITTELQFASDQYSEQQQYTTNQYDESNQQSDQQYDNTNTTIDNTPDQNNSNPNTSTATGPAKPKKTIPKRFKCDRCGRLFSLRHNLERHLRTACALNIKPEDAPKGPFETDLSETLIQPNPLTELQQQQVVFTPLVELPSEQPVVMDTTTLVPMETNEGSATQRPDTPATSDSDELNIPEHLLQNSDVLQTAIQATIDVPMETAKNVRPSEIIGYKAHKCPSCDSRFGTYQALNAHVKIHNKVNPYTCGECNRIFNGKKDLLRHRRDHLPEQNGTNKPPVRVMKKFECCVCGLYFTSNHDLARHLQNHSEEKLFACEQCKMSFDTVEELIVHTSQHDTKHTTPEQQMQNKYQVSVNTGPKKVIVYTSPGNPKPFFPQQSGEDDDLNASRDSGLGKDDVDGNPGGQPQMMTILSVVEKKPTNIATSSDTQDQNSLDGIMDDFTSFEGESRRDGGSLPPAKQASTQTAKDDVDSSCSDSERISTSVQASSPMTVTSSVPSCPSPAPSTPRPPSQAEDDSDRKPSGSTSGYIELQPMTFPGHGSILYRCPYCHETFINADNLRWHQKLTHQSGNLDLRHQNFTQQALMANF